MFGALVLVAMVGIFFSGGTVLAVTSTSPNYQVTEMQFGTSQKSCSGQYCAQASIGKATDGKTTATSTASFEEVLNNDPFLDMIVEPGESNLGVLTTTTTATKTTTIKIRSHLIAGGYTLQILGTPPKFKDHTLATPSSPTASIPGVEMFGINVVANTTPAVGANPVQVPDGGKVFGAPEPNYNTANRFMYASNDVIAKGKTDSGRTDYTVSMIVNISNATPAGKYEGDFMAMVIPAY